MEEGGRAISGKVSLNNKNAPIPVYNNAEVSLSRRFTSYGFKHSQSL